MDLLSVFSAKSGKKGGFQFVYLAETGFEVWVSTDNRKDSRNIGVSLGEAYAAADMGTINSITDSYLRSGKPFHCEIKRPVTATAIQHPLRLVANS